MGEPRGRRRAPAVLRRAGPVLSTLIALLAVFSAVLVSTTGAQEVPELQINSKRYIVIDAETGEIFAQRRAHERAAMASLTKVFTAIEAIESAPPSLEITTSAADMVDPRASVMGFGPDETFTLEELLYGLMLPSGNDAAQAIARALGAQPGDTAEAAKARFLVRMNQRVRDLGLTDTALIRPDGWGVPGHYSTAHDLAVFTMYALRYPRFVDLISTRTYETANGYFLTNNNRLLNSYENLVGGKTGYDDDAGWCLIEVAERDGDTMISVTMDGIWPEDWYDDNRVLLEYAFEQKAARRAAGLGVVGEVVGYRDPDAAVVSRVARPGAALGLSAAPPPAADGIGRLSDAVPVEAGAPSVGTSVAGDAGQGRRMLAAFGVAALLILGRTASVFRSSDARRGGTSAASAESPGLGSADEVASRPQPSKVAARGPAGAMPSAARVRPGGEGLTPTRGSRAVVVNQ